MKKLTYLLLAVAAVVVLQSCKTEEKKPLELNVMTFNVRLDVESDSLNNWKYRKEAAIKTIEDYDVDILGTQEPRPNQIVDLKEGLKGYTMIGVGREDGKDKGEYSAIFYKTDRFTALKSGTFWLSETPEVAGSKGWDAACERVATWAVLEDKTTKKQVFAVNTHLDHVGQKARIEGVTLMLNRAHEMGEGLPVILTGDFNVTPESDVVKHVVSETTPNNLISSRTIAVEKKDKEYTFHDFGRLPMEKREYIDYIFVSKGSDVSYYEVVEEKMGDVFITDHCPVFAKVSFK